MTTETKACIACAEDIKAQAVLCRFCGTNQADARFGDESHVRGQSSTPDEESLRSGPSKIRNLVALGVVSIVVISGITVAGVAYFASINQSTQSVSAVPAPTTQTSGLNIAQVYDDALPSVVTVYCANGFGSGFSYAVPPASGYRSVIVTNEHVVSDCTVQNGPGVSIESSAGRSISGTLWAWDIEHDLAISMIRELIPPLTAAQPGAIGDPVRVMGSPSGLQGTVTTGILSQVYTNAYQTDAAMNQGNSGGPLLDREGKVLGVNTGGFGREGLNIAQRIELLCEKVVTCGR